MLTHMGKERWGCDHELPSSTRKVLLSRVPQPHWGDISNIVHCFRPVTKGRTATIYLQYPDWNAHGSQLILGNDNKTLCDNLNWHFCDIAWIPCMTNLFNSANFSQTIKTDDPVLILV
jgi:hypothetical protein